LGAGRVKFGKAVVSRLGENVWYNSKTCDSSLRVAAITQKSAAVGLKGRRNCRKGVIRGSFKVRVAK